MTKQTLKPALFWLMTLALLWSCQEPLESPLALDTDLTLQEAQSFYEQLQANSLEADRNSKATKRSKKTSRQAFWDKQEKYKLGNQELITIPILFDDDLNTPGYGFKKMVFYKDTKTNKTNARIIEYIFDKDYLAKNFGNLSMKTFTGMMIVYDADGNYMDGTAVQNGKPTSKVTVALDGEMMKAKNANGRESATSSCVVSFITSGCSGGSSAIGGANQSGSGDAELLSALKNCASVYIYSLSCDSQGGTGSQPSLGFPYPLPGLVGPNPWDTFSGFAGGGNTGGGYVYSGPNTGASITQNLVAGMSSIYPGVSFSGEENNIMAANPWMIPIVIDYINENLNKPDFSPDLIYKWITDARIKSIYDALKNSSTILDDFASTFSSDRLHKLVYKDVSDSELIRHRAGLVGGSLLGATLPYSSGNSSKWYMVYLNRDKLNSLKKIYTALTILHETLHAKFQKELYIIDNDPSLNETQRRQILVNRLLYNFDEKYPDKTSLAHHQKIAEEYIKPMADALWKYHNKKFPLHYYENFAWLGLEETSAWLTMNGLQKDAIRQTRLIFDNE